MKCGGVGGGGGGGGGCDVSNCLSQQTCKQPTVLKCPEHLLPWALTRFISNS